MMSDHRILMMIYYVINIYKPHTLVWYCHATNKISWVDHINIHYWDHFTLTNAELAQWLFIRRSIGHRGMLLAVGHNHHILGFF